MKKLKISIIIPTYNGLNLLKKYLPSVTKACKKCKNIIEILIVDDGSKDNTISFLKKIYPDIKIASFTQNQGFIHAVNYGVKACKGNLVLLLNNDVEVDLNFIEPLVNHFYIHEDLFSVIPKSIITYQGKKNRVESVARGIWKNGMLVLDKPCLKYANCSIKSTVTNFQTSGGFSLFDRKKFLSLGGFDNLYYPFCWEDIDISYRAWKKGWKIFYEPDSIVHHKYHCSVSKIMKDEDMAKIWYQHNLLFIWKNITDNELLQEHVKYLNSKLVDNNEIWENINIYNALKRIDDVLNIRSQNNCLYEVPDKEIIKISANIPV